MPTHRAPQYIVEAIERLRKRAERMEKTHFGLTEVRYRDPGEDETATTADEFIKSKTAGWRASWLKEDLQLLEDWATGQRVDNLSLRFD